MTGPLDAGTGLGGQTAGQAGDRRDELAQRLAQTRRRIARACADAGRGPDEVTLITVTKFFPASDAAALASLGAADLGESREQEAAPKVARCAELLAASQHGREAADAPRWHMVGRLQRNKARAVARWAHAAHSVDSVRLARALDRAADSALHAGERTRPLEVYLQVSLDGDPSRGGVPEDGLAELADAAARADALRLAGLMAVAPRGEDPAAAFARLTRIRESFIADHPGAAALSAGMSGDLEAAVAHGSTCVRVGTAILGPRPIVSR